MNNYIKELDEWDNLVVFFCKHHFDKEFPFENKIDALKLILAERNAYNNISISTVYEYLMSNIVEPFISSNYPDIWREIIQSVAPENAWKVGYFGGFRFNDGTIKFEYNYWDAIIYALISKICLTEVKYLPGLKLQPDVELFKKCLERKNNN